MRHLHFAAANLLLLVPLLFGTALCRALITSCPPELVSDGVDENGFSSANPLGFKVMESGEDQTCEQMYGFLPCSKTIPGHLFLIVVYEYLLFHAESYVASGGERIFKILGPGVFGASAFQLIGSLPEASILLASGLLSSDESAQEYVLTGVGLLTGSSILLLTALWGTCVLVGSQSLSSHLHSNLSENETYNHVERLLSSLWPAYGVVTDSGTSRISRIMLLSVIPLMMIQLPRIFHLSHAVERIFVLITLVVSGMFLLCHFTYQCCKPWIQKRRLMYIKHERFVVEILKHFQNQRMGKLLNDDGSPNVITIRRLFEERDQNGDKVISFSELKEFLQEIKLRQSQSGEDEIAAQIMEEFDADNDKKITIDEFVNGVSRWVDEAKDALNKRYHSVKSLKDLYKILKPWIKKKEEEREVMRHLIPAILENFQNSVYGGLQLKDGSPDVNAITRLFKDIDTDRDGSISYTEMKEHLSNIKCGIITNDPAVAASKIMEELDLNGNNLISEDEFVIGLSRWLNETYHQTPNLGEGGSGDDDSHQKSWEQIDVLAEHKLVDKSPLGWAKAIALVVLGIVMLGVLAEPLIHSVRQFSRAANVPSFYVAFVFVPLATNARIAVSAFNEAGKKKQYTTSLTLSEIYGTVFMNNVLGLAVLLSLIYFRGLPWNFSVEVSMVLMASGVIGCLASFNKVFPVWTAIFAYLLYPLALILVYILRDANWLF